MLHTRRVVIKNLRDTAGHIEKWQECGRKLEQSGLHKVMIIETAGSLDGGSYGELGCQPNLLTT